MSKEMTWEEIMAESQTNHEINEQNKEPIEEVKQMVEKTIETEQIAANNTAGSVSDTGLPIALSHQTSPAIQLGIWSSPEAFETAQRMAKALSASTLVPKEYQGPSGIPNILIALDIATRTNFPPMAVMQNLYIVNGRPSWSSQFIVAVINQSRRFNNPIQFEMSGEGDDYGCVAWVIDQQGNRLEGTRISIKMAKDEGWFGKSGSKWKTMPGQMLKYRAASFFGRAYCPDLIMGVYTVEENYERGPDIDRSQRTAVVDPFAEVE